MLSAAGKTTEIRVRGSVESNYRTAYDILVRPRASATSLERSQGLVRNNYLSGLFGGVTLKQWREIKAIAGVEVAAPVANIGFVIPAGFKNIQLNSVLNSDPVQIYRIRSATVAHRGTSRYPLGTDYVYYTRRNAFAPLGVQGGPREIVAGGDEPVEVCSGSGEGDNSTPFQVARFRSCYSSRSPGEGSDVNSPGKVIVGRGTYFPLLLAAIDPGEEAKLLGLDRTIVSGRYLRARDRPRLERLPPSPYTPGRISYHRVVPVLASTRTYLDEYLEVRVERLAIPAGTDVPQMLASPRGDAFLDSLAGNEVALRTVSEKDAYAAALAGSFAGTRPNVNISRQYWIASPSRYQQSRGPLLTPLAVRNPASVWQADPAPDAQTTYANVPRSNMDVQFRKLEPRIGSIYFDRFEVPGAEVMKTPVMRIVGRYDPEKLPGFSALSKVPLETYYPPKLLPADEASRRALGGRPLLPSQNIGDYVAQPPLFLTTLNAMRPFLRPKYYAGASEAAPISVIRVRVAGVSGPDALSQARVRAVATEIYERTGLQVDITAGSSPQRLLVKLPPGRFGRPGLLLEEGWSKKGVSVSFLQALDRKRLGLLSLILVASAFFVGNAAFASVRGRRREIGTLLCLGWSQRAVFRVVLAELALVGLVAGLIGAALAAGAARVLSLELSLARTLLVAPIALALALVAGLIPAWRAGRLQPLDAIQPPVWASRSRRRVGRLSTLALANLRRVPARSLVGMAGLYVGVGSLTLLIALNQSFQGRLVGTLLGEAISVQVRGLDFLTVGLIVALAGLSLADVLYLNLRERAAEIVTLRTFGWSDRHLQLVIALEALLLGAFAGLAGALTGTLLGSQLGAPSGPLALGAAAGIIGGVLVALVASLVPLYQLNRLSAPAILAEE